jgi:hypothetical protein
MRALFLRRALSERIEEVQALRQKTQANGAVSTASHSMLPP